MNLNLPNWLTLSRIGVIPPLIALFYWDSPLAGWVACGLFTVAGITDFFDGYLARTRNEHSLLGRMLDPIADKLLVASVILMLVAFDRAPLFASVVILCRELLVSGLRDFLAELRVGMPAALRFHRRVRRIDRTGTSHSFGVVRVFTSQDNR